MIEIYTFREPKCLTSERIAGPQYLRISSSEFHCKDAIKMRWFFVSEGLVEMPVPRFWGKMDCGAEVWIMLSKSRNRVQKVRVMAIRR